MVNKKILRGLIFPFIMEDILHVEEVNGLINEKFMKSNFGILVRFLIEFKLSL